MQPLVCSPYPSQCTAPHAPSSSGRAQGTSESHSPASAPDSIVPSSVAQVQDEAISSPARWRVAMAAAAAALQLSQPAAAAFLPPQPSVAATFQGERATLPSTLSHTPGGSVSVEQARASANNTDFAQMSPYVATIAQSIDALVNTTQQQGERVLLELPQHFGKPLPVEVNFSNGPHAPTVIILPGLNGDSRAGQVDQLKDMVVQRALNYVVVPNPWSTEWIEAQPLHLPGVLPAEIAATQAALEALHERYPAQLDQVSVVGTSYGALLGVGLLQAEQQGEDPVINGSVVAVSPPENLVSSMAQLDALADTPFVSFGEQMKRGIAYASTVYRGSYREFMRSPLAHPGSDTVERALTFSYGPGAITRSAFSAMHEHLSERIEQMQDHSEVEHEDRIIERLRTTQTFGTYASDVLPIDPWFAEHGTSLQQEANRFELNRLLSDVQGKGVPVMVLTSQDDFILHPRDVERIHEAAIHPSNDQVIRQYATGGHLGLLFNPSIRGLIVDFAGEPPSVPAQPPPAS